VDVDPAAASAAALQQYDTSGDGALDDTELAAVPGIQMAKAFYDKDSDGRVSGDEIAARIEKWNEQGLGFRPLAITFTLDGKPLGGVEVKLVPESYLGEAVKPATGITLPDGTANLSVAKEDLPEALKARKKNFYGVTGGTYKIELTSTRQKLPPKFNSQTTLGVEVAIDTVRASHHVQLRSK
jgi:hypothetical protein